MNVKDIITDFLRGHGCDGLCNPFGECGCDLDVLMPCNEGCGQCVPAMKATAVTSEDDPEYVPANVAWTDTRYAR